ATACKRSTLALAEQSSRRGLGMIVSTGEPGNLEPALLRDCRTHLYGRVNSPAALEAVNAMIAAKGGDDAARLKPGEFYFAGEELSRPVKSRASASLSRRGQNAPSAAEVAAIARRSEPQERNSAK